MERLFLTGITEKIKHEKRHLFLPSVKQPVDLPRSEPERSIEEMRRRRSNEDKMSISKLTTAALNQKKGYWFHVSRIREIEDPGALNMILGKHPFPLCQGPIVIPLDNNVSEVVGEGYVLPSGKLICPPMEKPSAKEVFESRTMFKHDDEQQCFEWIPTQIGTNAWNPDIIKSEMYDLKDPVHVHNIQGPASTKTMHIVYTCNKMNCIVYCPCTLCNDSKSCKLLCHDQVCVDCNSQCLDHQIKLPRLFNPELDLFTLVTNKLDSYRYGIPYAGIPASCSQCSSDVQEHQTFHLVFHMRCRFCRYDARPFERRNIVNVEDYQEAEKLIKWVDERTCSYCTIKYKDKFKRETHEATVHEGKGSYKCEICGKNYSNKNALSYHINNKHKSEAEEGRFCCDVCPSMFTTNANLKRHLHTVHLDPCHKSKFECDKCDKIYSRQDKLKIHQREKHFAVNVNVDFLEDLDSVLQNKCDQCNKSFKRKFMLQRHVRTVHCEGGVKNNLNV